MRLCFVSIGSNIERERNMRSALQLLNRVYGPLLASAVYETPAIGFDGDPFYNAVVAFGSNRPVQEIHDMLRKIEAAHGRVRNGPRLSARTLDLDILLYGNMVRHDEEYDLPRNEIAQHAFVLGPLAEIAPDMRHPESGQRYAELWQAFGGDKSLKPVRFPIY